MPFRFGQLVCFYQFVQDSVACQTNPVLFFLFSIDLSVFCPCMVLRCPAKGEGEKDRKDQPSVMFVLMCRAFF